MSKSSKSLACAIAKGAVEEVQALVDAGIKLNGEYFFEFGDSPVIFALVLSLDAKISEKIVTILLDAGSDVNATDAKGETPLILSAGCSADGINGSSEKCTRILLGYGAKVNAQTGDGLTALMDAAGYSTLASTEYTVKMLLEAGADVKKRDSDGMTAIDHAVKYIMTSSAYTITLLVENIF